MQETYTGHLKFTGDSVGFSNQVRTQTLQTRQKAEQDCSGDLRSSSLTDFLGVIEIAGLFIFNCTENMAHPPEISNTR